MQTVITFNLADILAKRDITIYRLSKDSEIPYATCWNLANGKARSLTFDVLNSLCRTLQCQPGDLLTYSPDK